MKKRSTKSLKLRKSSVSNLENSQLKGGTLVTTPIITKTGCTSFIDACPSAWICPTDFRNCPFPF